MSTAHVYFSGLVQGIGFRKFVKYCARKAGVNGWVTNKLDGRVEAVFQSENKKTIEKVIQKCEAKYFLAEVKSVKVEWIESNDLYREFVIVK